MCECVFGEPSCLDVLGESMIFFQGGQNLGGFGGAVGWLHLRKIAKDDFYIPIGKDGVYPGSHGHGGCRKTK